MPSGDAKAAKLLETAKTAAEAILEDETLVKKWPALRFGSLAAALGGVRGSGACS